jgi:hypothetical protein
MKGDLNRCLDLLGQGPATSYEIGVAMNTDVHHASALLAHLRRCGVVTSDKGVIRTGGRPAQLWRLAA